MVEIECRSFNPEEQDSPDFVKEEPSYLECDDYELENDGQFDLTNYHTTNDGVRHCDKPRFSELLPNRTHIVGSFTQFGGGMCDASTDFEKSPGKLDYAKDDGRLDRSNLLNSIFSHTGM